MSIVIEMVSDLVCPWCWLGLRRLQAARDLVPDVDCKVLFRPFELDATVPREGADYKAYMSARMGGDGGPGDDAKTSRFRAMREALEQYGEAEGIPFNFGGITVRPNTLDAHRLVRWAQGQDKGEAAKDALFHAYFADNRDIGDSGVLTDVGSAIGLDAHVVRDLLASDADEAAVREEAAVFRQMGIQGVPTYVGNRSVAVQGAESAEKLARFITTLAAQQPKERPASTA